MIINDLINFGGILFIITGALLGAYGFINSSENDILIRSDTSYLGSNPIQFKSMMEDKYFGAVGFLYILIGSIIQIVALVNDLSQPLVINKPLIILLFIAIALILFFTTKSTIEWIILNRSNKVFLKSWLKAYLSYKEDKKFKGSEVYYVDKVKEHSKEVYPKKVDLEFEELVKFLVNKLKIKNPQ